MSSPFGTSHDWPFSAPQLKAMQFDGGLDFNSGKIVWWLFARLDAVVSEAGGRIYPAKDGRMPAQMFQAGYPAWQAFTKFIDPRFSSSFWRRVTQT